MAANPSVFPGTNVGIEIKKIMPETALYHRTEALIQAISNHHELS
jgi:hypothetical protein